MALFLLGQLRSRLALRRNQDETTIPRLNPAQLKTHDTSPELRAEWGHPILTPEDEEIRIPQTAFDALGRMGVIEKNRQRGLQQITDAVYAFMPPEYDGLMDGLRQLLGEDMSGPGWVQCQCRQCHRKKEEADKTQRPDDPTKPRRGRYWLKVIRSAPSVRTERAL